MCTAITYKTKDHYFGRNLDLDYTYDERVTIMPRNFPFAFRHVKLPEKSADVKWIDQSDDTAMQGEHYAIIGMATVVEGYPLFYDATNEKGLSMAGLNFPGNADYKPYKEDADNVTPFELIPWILRQCCTVEEAGKLLERINLLSENFSEKLPLSPLHWMIADREKSIVVESVKEGLKVYDNPVEVLTNNPTFDDQLFNLNHYMSLSVEEPVNMFSKKLDLIPYSRGMGAIGLPGDLSSRSRFVKAAFTRLNSVSGDSESASISQFFHILGSVAQQRGCVRVGDRFEITHYTSCCNTDKGIYYYTTYENSRISAVDMHKVDLKEHILYCYPLITEQQITMQN